MKHTIERITQRIVSVPRFVAILLAALAAGEALATDSLEETGGVLSAVGTDTLAFKGVTLSELTAETLHGRMSGDWAGTAATESFTFNNFDRSNEGEGSGYITCQAQLEDDGYLKGMVLKFTQSGDDINVQIVSAGAVNGGSIGGSVAGQTGSNSHYAIYNLFLTRTWSDSAVVLWEAGQFGVLSKTGSDGNTYTLNLNSNSNGSGEAITIDQSVGVKVTRDAAFPNGGITVLFRYSNLNRTGAEKQVLATTSLTGTGNKNRTGVYLTSAGATHGIWNGAAWSDDGTSMTYAQTAGVLAFTHYGSSNYYGQSGTCLYYLANGSRTQLYNAGGLGSNNDINSYEGVAIGGRSSSADGFSAATGMKITGIAIFKGVLTESQMTSFVWPSASEKYSKFSYISAARRLTWTTASTVTGDIIANASTQYTVFDIQCGDNTATTYDSGTASGSNGHWNYVCYSSNAGNSYVAPGSLLRFVKGDGYAHSLAGSFSPLTLGGIIVEEGATGYNFAQNGSRYSIFGDPTNTTETYFDFYEDFKNARNAGCHLDGTINITVASGKTFTIAGTTTKCATSVKGTSLSGTAGGVLKLHGGGHLAATLTASDATLDYTDLSATVSSSSDAYIQGTLTVNSGTVIALPADATFPYFVASAASGTLDPANGVTIGGVAAPGYKLKSDGSVVAPRTVTISGNETWGTGTLNGWPTDDSTEGYAITVTADATLTLPSAVSCDVLSITVEDGVTLTISGNTITAADCFYLTGTGTVKVGAGNTFIGTVKGDGNLAYPDNTIPTASTAVFTRLDWSGTLILSSIQGSSSGQPGWYAPFHNYGNTNSTIKVVGFTGFFAAGNRETAATLEIAAGTTFTLNNGNNGNSMTFGKLTGSGDIVICGANGPAIQYVMRDASEFAGSITVSQSGSSDFKKSIVLGGSSYNYNTSNYQKQICVLGDVTIAAGKTWTADSGIVNNGTITLNGALSGTVTGSGTVECGQGVDLTGSGFSDSANWTGTVRLNGDATPVPSTSYDETSYGNASSTLEIASGSVAITEATTLPGTVNVASSASLFVTSSATELTLAGSNSGTINLSMASALTTLTLNLTGNGSIVYPSSLTTLNVTYTESLADDGVKAFTVNGATFAGGTMTLVRPDGTEESVTGTVSGNKITFTWTPTVSGAACWVDYEMNGSNANTGTEGTAFSYDGSYTAGNSFYDSKFLYTYTHPYRNNLDAYPDSWTAVVRCTVPNLANAAIITFGNQTSGLIGLIAGDNPGSEMKLIQTTGNSAYSTKATMTVQDATSAQHVYVFAVENKRTLKCWCDGTQVLNENLAADVSIGYGFQIGSVVYGVGNTGIVRWWPGDTAFDNLDADVKAAARIDCLRLYKGVLGPNAIAQLSVEFPAVKLFQATIAGGNDNEWDSLSWTGGDISTLNEYSKIILTVTDDATLTLPSTVTAEEFTINVTAGKTLTLLQAAGGTTFSLTNPIEVNNGSLRFPNAATIDFAINGTGTVRVGSGETLNLVDGGSVPGLTGAGTLNCSSMSALPGAFTFTSWTGTVSLPSFNASSGVNFNYYGTTGSTVALAGMTGGYILEAGKTVNPTLRLDGAMNINDMSTWTYTFSEITGTGSLSFSTSSNTPTVNITKVAEGYSGTISSSLANAVTIATLERVDGVKTAGTKLLDLGDDSANITVTTATVGGTRVPHANKVFSGDRGIYIVGGTTFSVY